MFLTRQMKIICQLKQFHAPIQETPEVEGQVKLQSALAGSYITPGEYVNTSKKINKQGEIHTTLNLKRALLGFLRLGLQETMKCEE